MTEERWEKVKTIFDRASACEPASREAFLRAQCGDDEGLRGAVESLLAGEPGVRTFGERYEVERELGRGGMSVVYLARDHQLLGKRVVIKVLLERAGLDAWIRQKFLQEMEALARIDHPGVVGVLDSGLTAEGKQFLVMQYVEGETLRAVMQAGQMDFARAAGLIRQAGQALAAAHEKGVWHRDLKPENIMVQHLGGEDYIRIIDFGIAGIQNSEFTGEQTKVAGTMAYMAPEQFAGQPCAASDTFALAVVTYELLTGTLPSPTGELAAKLPDALRRTILRALSAHPDLRHRSIREFGDEVWLAVNTGEASRAPAVPGSVEMAHVLFTDLVGYSLLPMDHQRKYLEELQQIVRDSPRFRAAETKGELISLPTGDGMALAFFNDPTAPVQCALEVGARLKGKPHLKLRMGIHSGPVYRVADVNANANVAGGGINMAQRVMDCGDAGHILLSKSAAEVLLQLSHWAPYLSDLGECTVKHGVKVHLYSLASVEYGSREIPSKMAAGRPKTKIRAISVTAAIALTIAAAGTLYLARPARILTGKDTIVLAGFTNTTSDPVFDGTLQKALALKLGESPFLNVLSDDEMGRTMVMMGRPASETITPQTGREVCVRNGLKAAVSGSISQLGETYLLQLDAVNCATGELLARAGSEAKGKSAVLPALGKAATEVRRKLGESLSSIKKFDKLEMTSSSLPALQAYVMAQKASREGRPKEQLAMLNHAIELDPNFTLAYVSLSAVYTNLRQSEKAAEYGRKAFELRDRVTEREKFALVDRYYGSVTGEIDKRIESATVWSMTYPRDGTAFMDLGIAYANAGQYEKALPATLEAMRLNPELTAPYRNIIGYYAALGRYDEAKRAVEEARKHRLPARRLTGSSYELAFVMHDDAGMAQAVRQAAETEGSMEEMLVEQAMTEAYYGHLRKAGELFDQATQSADRARSPERMALIAAVRAHVEALLGAGGPARNDAQAALKVTQERDVMVVAGWALAHAGDAARASAVDQELVRRFPLHTLVTRMYLPALRGDLAILANHPERAIDGLREAGPYELASGPATGPLYAVYIRGQAYLKNRQGQAASAEFQKIIDHPGIVTNSPVGPLAVLGLAEAYAMTGETAKVLAACRNYFALWKEPDAELPVAAQADRLCTGAGPESHE